MDSGPQSGLLRERLKRSSWPDGAKTLKNPKERLRDRVPEGRHKVAVGEIANCDVGLDEFLRTCNRST